MSDTLDREAHDSLAALTDWYQRLDLDRQAYPDFEGMLDRLCRAHEALERERCVAVCRERFDLWILGWEDEEMWPERCWAADQIAMFIEHTVPALRAPAPVREPTTKGSST